MSSFQFTCAYGGNMIIIKLRFLKRRLERQLLAAILGLPLTVIKIFWSTANNNSVDELK
jgi:hypothetical protein